MVVGTRLRAVVVPVPIAFAPAAATTKSKSCQSTLSRVWPGASRTGVPLTASSKRRSSRSGIQLFGPVPNVIAHQRANSPRSARAAVASAVGSFSAAPSAASVPSAAPANAAATARPSANIRRRTSQDPRRVGRDLQRKGGAQLGAHRLRHRRGERPSRLQPIECAVRGPRGFAGDERLDHVGVRRVRQHRAALRLPAVEARFGLHERDLHRRAGILAGQLSELPLAREHPERVLDRGRKAAPGVATARDRLDPRERVDGRHAVSFATQRTGNWLAAFRKCRMPRSSSSNSAR